jgi:hypothetical protein
MIPPRSEATVGVSGMQAEAGRCARWRGAVVAALVGATVLCADADAEASLTAPGSVRTGHNIGVFHEIDFISAFGHTPGERLTVEVFRGDHRIARVAAPALATPGGAGLEINHGPEGAPRPGDCWSQVTPDIRPYDRIRVTSANGGTDEILVDDIVVESGPVIDAAAPADVVLTGHARSALGGPVTAPLEAEFRSTSKLRGGPTRIERRTEDTFKVVYTTPAQMERGGSASAAQLMAGAAEHTVGFGHVDPASPETQIADAGGAPGPAVGCEALAPAAGGNAATTLDDDVSGPGSGDLAVSGTAIDGVSEVAVTVDDGPGGGDPVVTSATAIAAAPNAPAGADRAWGVAFTADQLAGFPAEADLTVTPAFTGAGAASAAPLRIRRDTVAPAAPAATPGPGTYTGPRTVELRAEPGAAVHYTTDGSAPTTASPRFGADIDVDRTMTIRAIAVDAAGNVSPVAALAFTIRATGAGAPRVVVLGVVDARAAVPVIGSIAPTDPAVTLRVRGLSAPARVTRTAARRRGVVASFVTPAGAGYARVRLYRVGGGQRRLLATRVMAATPGARQTARFTSAGIRRRLTAGRYAVEVRTGPSPASLGPAAIAPVRVAR